MGLIGSFIKQTINQVIEQTSSNLPLVLALTASGGTATVVAYKAIVSNQTQTAQNTVTNSESATEQTQADNSSANKNQNQEKAINTQFTNARRNVANDSTMLAQSPSTEQTQENKASEKINTAQERQAATNSGFTSGYSTSNNSNRGNSRSQSASSKDSTSNSVSKKSSDAGSSPSDKKILGSGGSENGNTGGTTDSGTIAKSKDEPPVIQLTALTGGQNIRGNKPYTLTWKASGQHVTAATPISIEFSSDNGSTWSVSVSKIANSGTYSWNVPNVSSATCLVRVSVQDDAGLSASAQSTTAFTVDNVPPTLTLIAPIGGESIKGGGSFNILWSTIEANPAVTPIKVEYTADGSTWNTIGTYSSAGPATWTIPSIDSSIAQVRVTATDLAGNSTSVTSLPFSIDGTIPTISSVTTTLASGAYPVGQVIPIDIHFSETIAVTGTPQLTLNTTPTARVLNFVSSSGSVMSFSYTVQSGDNSTALDYASTTALSLNGGTIKDTAGNNATLTLPTPTQSGSISASKTIVIDTIAPNRPNIYLTSPYFAQTTAVTMTAANCTDTTELYITEDSGETPTGTEVTWQACSTTASAITYTLASSTVGSHNLYIWAKDSDGNISATAKTIPLKYVPELILGQADETKNDNHKVGFYAPTDIKQINGKVYIVSSGTTGLGYSKISVFNSVPTSNFQMPDLILGQAPNFLISTAAIGPNRISQSYSVDSDGTHFAVNDFGNNRILLWNSVPTNPDTPADIVLGQSNFWTNSENNGKGQNSTLLDCADIRSPRGIKIYGGKLYVTDSGNNRLLVWNNWPTSNNQAADIVLGQTSCSAATSSASTMGGPTGVEVTANNLFVADSGQNRVLIWNSIPTTSGQSPDLVLGQSNFTNVSANSGGIDAASLQTPRLVKSDGTHLIVSDYSNKRILIWNTIPTVNKQAADVVVGQADFTSAGINQNGEASATSLHYTVGLAIINGDLWIADQNNNRILRYNGIPTTNGAAATYVLGQENFRAMAVLGNGTNAHSVNRPFDVELINNGFIYSSVSQHRIVGYNSWPTNSLADADFQWGQADFNSDNPNRSQSGAANSQTLYTPTGILQVNGKFFIADFNNNRILGFNSVPTSSTAVPDFVLGQPNFNSATANNGGVSAASLQNPRSMASDGTKFAVTETTNNRVLIWNTIPTSNAQPADVVIGQPDMTSNASNNGGESAATLAQPQGVVLAENKLIVADSSNRRILIWDPIPTVSGTPANYVIGQTTFNSAKSYDSALGPLLRITPYFLSYKNGKLVTAESRTSTILIWDSIPTSNNKEPDRVFGSSAYTTVSSATALPTLSKYLLAAPNRAQFDGSRLWIADNYNHRINVVAMPEVSVTSGTQTNSPNITLTMHDCSNRSAVFFNETTQPSASAAGWQSCVTTRNAMTYTLSNGDGLKNIKVWYKDSDGNVLPIPHKVTVWYLTSNSSVADGTMSVTTSTNSPTITYTPVTIATQYYFSENPTTPNINDVNWQPLKYPLTYTLSNTTDGTKTIYVWTIDLAGNISPTPTTYRFVYDTTPPVVPSVTVDGYYAATTATVARATVSSCADASKIFINDTGVTPTTSTSGWVTCTTATNGISTTLSNNTEGNHTLSVWAQDTAGNISSTPATLNFNFNSSLVLGQASSSEVSTAATGLSAPNDITSDGTNFYVADTFAGRVLIYNGDPTQTNPSIVLGQNSLTEVGAAANSTQGASAGATASNMWNPYSVAVTGTKLIVTDEARHRILIWNTIPTTNNQPADVVLGQSSMSGASANAGSTTRSCAGLSNPRDAQTDGTRLIVSDYSNHRVLIWNTIPTSNNAPADVVIGQTSCTTGTSGTTQTTLKNPISATIYGSQVFIADYANNRVLIYNSIPTTNGAAADIVLGQADFISGAANAGGSTSASTLSNPKKVRVYNNKLYVNDSANSRILVYNSIPISNNVPANVAVGQTSLSTKVSGSSATAFSSPFGIFINSSYLYVADTSNHQIKRFSMPLTTGMSSTAFAGSFSYSYTGQNIRNSTTSPTQSTMQRPTTAIKVGTKLIVSDYFNHRILIWNTMPTTTNQNADVVIGHNDFVTPTNNDPALTQAARLSYPAGLSSDGTNLVVGDSGNNRVLIFNSIPTANGASADLVLGQANFTTLTANRGGSVAANTMSGPFGVYTNGTRLYVADYSNNRVLMWTTFPTTNGQAADIVLGQANMTSNSTNQNGTSTPSAITMSLPRGVLEDNGKLFVSEYGNNRVLIWNNIPSSNDPAADVVVGQTTMTTGSFGASASVYQRPYHMRVINGKLLIADGNNSRIIGFNSIPTTNGQTADFIIGQYATNGSSPNNRGISAWAYAYPTDIVADGSYYWVVDMFNHRLVKIQLPY